MKAFLLLIAMITTFAHAETDLVKTCRSAGIEKINQLASETGGEFIETEEMVVCGKEKFDLNWKRKIHFCARARDGRNYEVVVEKSVLGNCK